MVEQDLYNKKKTRRWQNKSV